MLGRQAQPRGGAGAARGRAIRDLLAPLPAQPGHAGRGRRARRLPRRLGSETRGRELDAQVAASGRAAGLEFRHELMLRTPNTIDAHRLIRLAGGMGGSLQNDLMEAVFRGYFQEGRDIGSHVVLAEIAAQLGLDAGEIRAYLAGDEGAEEVRAEDAAFRRGGLSGVPTFALEGHVLFSGAMPPENMAEAFRRGLAILRERAKAA
ncbi:DsbA family protein [Paeniroseomonas aquatica]|uniref:DsbA family protein n=1 Tax=Paeniroseomonas aquatica TaxID=373043 RepID=UPI00362297EA